MKTDNWQFFETQLAYRKALKESETVDGTSYGLSHINMPLNASDVDEFFAEWPQYAKFPFMDELKFNKDGKQTDAINALCDYTLYIDRTVFIF